MNDEHLTGAIAEIGSLPWFARLLAAVMLAGVGTGCAIAAADLATYRHWTAWLVLLLVVEPLALFSFAAAGFLIAPRSIIGRVFAFAMRRVKVALIVVGAIWCGTILWLIVYTAMQFFQ